MEPRKGRESEAIQAASSQVIVLFLTFKYQAALYGHMAAGDTHTIFLCLMTQQSSLLPTWHLYRFLEDAPFLLPCQFVWTWSGLVFHSGAFDGLVLWVCGS